MSVEATVWAWGQSLKAPQKLLLLALADEANTDGMVLGTSQSTLASRMGKTERTIRTQIGVLKEQGLLMVMPAYRTKGSKGGRAVDVYLLTLPLFESVLARLSEEGEKRLPEVFDKGLPEVFGTSETGSESQTGRLPEVFDEKDASISSCIYPVEDSRTQEKASTLNAVAASKVVAGGKVPNVTIDKLKLNDDEWQAALVIIRAFNEGAGTKFRLMGSRGDRPTEHLKRIVGRLRDNPEVTLDEHLAMIDRVCSNPWWKGTPTTVGVIYGPKVFARCLATDGRPTHGRTFANERRTSPEDAPW